MIPILLLLALGGLMQAARSFSPALASAGTELAFGFLLLSAYFSAKLLSRFGLPKLTGYIIAGVVAGPFVLGLVTHEMTAQLKVVNGVAVCILALTAGSELNLKAVKPAMKTLRSMTFWAVIGAMFAIAATLFAMRPFLPWLDKLPLDQAIAACGIVGVALSAQSPAVVMALIAETGSEGPVSRLMLASVVVADLVVILMYSLAATIASAVISGQVDVGSTAATVGWELGGSIGFGVAVGMLLGVFLRYVKVGASLFAVLVCIVVAEIGGRISLDPLIVMLAAGIWLENFSRADSSDLLHGFESAQLPVFLVFFAMAGSHLDIYSLAATIIPVAVLVVARTTTFFIGAKIACARTNAEANVRRFAWVGLMPQAGLALALALLIPKTFPSFGEQASVILFGVVGMNEMIAPLILKMVLMRTGEAGKRPTPEFAPEH